MCIQFSVWGQVRGEGLVPKQGVKFSSPCKYPTPYLHLAGFAMPFLSTDVLQYPIVKIIYVRK